jgi:subtilisin family serine protease
MIALAPILRCVPVTVLWLALVPVPSAAQDARNSDPYWTSSGSWGQSYRDKWGLERVGWTPELGAHAKSPIIVAVIDTGLDYYHPALPRENVFVNEKEMLNGRDNDGNGYVGDVVGWNFVDDNANPWDNAGHGTLVAGIIAEMDPQVRILPLKVLNFIGQGRASRVAEAIYYAVGMGARVINLSLGGEERSRAMERAIAYAGGKGALVVIAAGNTGTRITRTGPSVLLNVITVGATGVDDKRASFSNFGAAIDLAAPGVDILSLRARRTDLQLVTGVENYVAGKNFVGDKARYYRANGTSFAAPFVSGAAALILSQRPDLDAAAVKRMIVQSARDAGSVGVNPETGYGILDVKAALTADPRYFVEADIAEVSAQKTDAGVMVRVSGTADADRFASAWIEIGRGESPTEWRRISRTLDKAIRAGVLDDLPAQPFAGAPVWTLRLIVQHTNGKTRETRHVLRLG